MSIRSIMKPIVKPWVFGLQYMRSRSSLVRADDRSVAYMLMDPDYGNMGDLGIGWAQSEFMRREFPELIQYRVPLSETFHLLKGVKQAWRPGDIFMLAGGGFMGDFYPGAQMQRVGIAKILQGYPMVSFPQSLVRMSENRISRSMRNEVAALARQGNLSLFAREFVSLDRMQRVYENNVLYAPDIVFSLAGSIRSSTPSLPRSGAVLTLRSDRERDRGATLDSVVEKFLTNRGLPVTHRDNLVANAEVNHRMPYALAQDQINLYLRSEIVVTDRLHGMIFAAVTGTPCVVLPNTNHKIKSTYYDWLANQCSYIEFVDAPEPEALLESIEKVLSTDSAHDYGELNFDFSELSTEIARRVQVGKIS